MAECFFHTRGLRTLSLKIPGEGGGGGFGVKLSSNPGVVSKGNPVILVFPGKGILCYLEIPGLEIPGMGFFFIKSLFSAPCGKKYNLPL